MKCLDGELLETQYEWPTSVVGGEVNEETLMRSNEMSGSEMVEKTKSYLKKNGGLYKWFSLEQQQEQIFKIIVTG